LPESSCGGAVPPNPVVEPDEHDASTASAESTAIVAENCEGRCNATPLASKYRAGPTDCNKLRRIDRWLEHPRATRAIIALALVLALPSLAIGFYTDDYVTLGYLERRFGYDPPWWDLFVQTPRGIDGMHRLIASGEIPWWTTPELKMHFHRVLPSVALALDHVLFGHAALGWHVMSLAWYFALLWATASLFHRLLPRAPANLALLVFALSGANVFPFAWPAALYAPMAATFVALGLIAHVRLRREGWAPGRWLAPAAFVAGLASGEAALGGFAFAAAYDLAGPAGGAARERIVRALPLAFLAVAYLVVYAAAGGGASGSEAYISPLSEPGAFLAAAVTRVPVFLCDVVLGVPADFAFLGYERVLAVAGAVATVLFLLLARACAAQVPAAERAELRWLALGALGAMVVGLGGLIGSRDLLLANFGFAPVLAAVIRGGWSPGPLQLVRRVGAGVLALAHIALAPVGQLANELTMYWTARATEATAHAIERQAAGATRVMIVSASDPMASWYPQAVVAAETQGPMPCWSWLSGVPSDMTVTRSGPASFVLEPRGTTFLRAPFETLDRSPRYPFAAGDEVVTCGVRVRVAAVVDGRPSRIEVTSDADLDAPATAWLAWQSGAVSRVAFPPVGASMTIPWTLGPSGMF
jgi:hypothetical protein